jgi:hypothetical protein
MASDVISVRLFDDLDPARLLADLEAVQRFPRARQLGPYHDGEWTGVSFYSYDGRYENPDANLGPRPYVPTEALKGAPYIKECLDRLPCPKHSVRLLALPPNAEIRTHRDPDISWYSGKIRLHIPITTHPDVAFLIGGERQQWKAGELWYGDFSQPHSVKNDSSIVRFHVVIDVVPSSELVALFPAAPVDPPSGREVPLHRPTIAMTEGDLREYECAFAAMPYMRHVNTQNRKPVICELRAGKGGLQLWREEKHIRTLVPVARDEFVMVNAPAGVRLRFERKDGALATMTYEVLAVPVQTPTEFRLEDRRWTLHPIKIPSA